MEHILHGPGNFFADSEFEVWDAELMEWAATGISGSLQTYDRFISDRVFGQKKRIAMTGAPLDLATGKYFRVGRSGPRYMVESVNSDTAYNEEYSYIYMLREAPYFTNICKDVSASLVSGARGRPQRVVQDTCWVDYDRYTANDSKVFHIPDYTVFNLMLPSGYAVDVDTYLECEGVVFDVREVNVQLNLQFCRAQKRGV